MELVLYFQPKSEKCSPDKLAGVTDIASKAHYHVQVVEAAPTAKNLDALVKLWEPAGAIVDCGNRTGEVDSRAFGTLPTVYLCRDPATLGPDDFAVYHDNAETARAAAKELMLTGRGSFAIVPYRENQNWSRERTRVFLETLRTNGYGVKVFRASAAVLANDRRRQLALREFVLGLPRPAALFAVCDEMAAEVLAAARYSAIAVPDDLAVAGVDNYEPICERMTPRLTSVEPDFRRGGQLAMLMLLARIRTGERFLGERQRSFGPSRIVRRASTRPLGIHDPHLPAMLERIRRDACNGLTAGEVAAMMPASRPVVDARFRAATGRTILEEIHAVKLERAKDLLRNPNQMLKSISDFCGFSNPNSLRKFFLRETGMTMSAWRQASAGSRGS